MNFCEFLLYGPSMQGGIYDYRTYGEENDEGDKNRYLINVSALSAQWRSFEERLKGVPEDFLYASVGTFLITYIISDIYVESDITNEPAQKFVDAYPELSRMIFLWNVFCQMTTLALLFLGNNRLEQASTQARIWTKIESTIRENQQIYAKLELD